MRAAWWRTAVAAGMTCGVVAVARAESSGPTTAPAVVAVGKTIRVAIYDDTGGGGVGPGNVEKCLDAAPAGTYSHKRVKAEDLKAGRALKDVDVLVQPGGSGHRQADALGEDGRANVKAFVKGGGGYIGICAGSYLASSEYTWSLHILNSKVIDRQHWNRGKGTVTLRLTDRGKAMLGKSDETVSCVYAQGPLMAPGEEAGLAPYEKLATFDSEIAENGAPNGIMKDTTAIAAGTYFQGRVMCISPHPERSEGLDGFIRRAVDWVGKGEVERAR